MHLPGVDLDGKSQHAVHGLPKRAFALRISSARPTAKAEAARLNADLHAPFVENRNVRADRNFVVPRQEAAGEWTY